MPPFLAVLRNRNIALIAASTLISQFGTGITSVAASILVYRETGSALSIGLMLMVNALPGLLFGLIAGVFVDRVDRRKTLLITEFLAGILILTIPFALQYGIVWLYVIIALKSTIYQFFSPAFSSILPDVSGNDDLASANSLVSACDTGAMGLGFAIAGWIVSTIAIEWAFAINALTFAISALLLSRLKIPRNKAPERTDLRTVFYNLRAGTQFLSNSPALRSMILVIIPMGIGIGLLNSSLLPFTIRALGASEMEYSLIRGIGLIGFLLGSVMMTAFGDHLREGQWLAISFTGMGVLTLIYSQLTSVPAAIVFNTLFLFMNVPSFLGRALLIQRNTTRDIRGRVSSVSFVMRDSSFVIGMALAGISDLIDIRYAIVISGVLLLGAGLLAFMMPGLRRPMVEWAHSLELLRGIAEAPGVAPGRSIAMAYIERLNQLFPVINTLKTSEIQRIMGAITYTVAETGSVIVRQGEISDSAYFILKGRVLVGVSTSGNERVLAHLQKGDFFGEIAALKGTRRTASIIAEEPTELLRVPAETLLAMSDHPVLNRVFSSTMTERLLGLYSVDLPLSAARHDQSALRDLRTATHEFHAVTG